jgi:prevent-host-death family protein
MKDEEEVVINIHQAKTTFSALIRKVLAGQSVVIGKAGVPLVQIVPYLSAAKERQFGTLSGKGSLSEEFFEELPKDFIKHFKCE